MPNYFRDNDDLRWYFEKGIDWEPIVRTTEFDWKAQDAFRSTKEALEFYREILDRVGEFAAEELAPHAAKIDHEGVRLEGGEAVFPPTLAKVWRGLNAMELHGLPLPRELGGLNCPMMLYFLNSEVLGRADVSVMAHHGFHGGIAAALLIFSILEGTTTFDAAEARITSTRFREAIDEIVAGKAWGCMDITEPDAGSDMAAMRAYAEQDEQGQWYVTGTKIFITSGHGKYHFVIARTEKARPGAQSDPMAGLQGLSFFLVPTYHEDAAGQRTRVVKLARVEDKLGHHGSVTAALEFERAPAQLVGKRGEGFRQMLTLMNNARLGVGFESLGLCEAAYRAALAYAESRPSMGKPIHQHPMIADYLDEMRTDIQGIRALCVYGAFHEEMQIKEKIRRLAQPPATDEETRDLDRRIRGHEQRARRVTPLLKYLASEKAVEMSRRCIQIHGGNGYMKEYPAEKLLRDALVMPIYEGTSQIQSLMAMKDTLGAILKNPRGFVARIARARWTAISGRDPLERRVARVQQLSLSAQQHLVTETAGDKLRSLRGRPLGDWPRALTKDWNPKRDFAFAMLHAERLTRVLADEAVCEVLWEQAAKHPERREVLERYLDRCEPRVRGLVDEITTTGAALLARLHGAEDRDEAASAQAAE